MVTPREVEGTHLFFCEVCDFGYDHRERAEACEAYCRTHGACSVEITRHARVRGRP